MMRSLFSGVSGLRNHQVQMDVIGSNIANVNTVGYKASRVTFQENLAQALRESNGPRGSFGGSNPMQVGLGMSIGSIDQLFTQGNLENTGNVMDLAIQGDAFFMVSDGSHDYYTRAGNFQVDGNGNLVYANTGFKVQGRMADATGNILSSTPISSLVLPSGQKAPAKATKLIQFFCNLDADTYAKAQKWSSSFAKSASVTSSALTAPIDLTTANSLSITIDDDSGGTTTKTLTLTAGTYNSVSDVVAEINAQIANERYLAGEVVAEVSKNGSNEMIKIRTTDAGGSDTEITLGGSAATPLSLSTTRATGTTAASSLNDLPFVSEDVTDGDEILITGTNPDGSSARMTYTYATGDTLQDVLDAINSSFSGSTATLESDGSLCLTDVTNGESKSSISLSFVDNDSNSVVSIPNFVEKQTGEAGGTHTASIFVYDSKGNTHTVAMTFTNVSSEEEPNTWRWEANVDNGEITPAGGNKGVLKFNSDGSLTSFEVDDDLDLTFVPDGADTMRISLEPGDTGTLNGITQLASPTTTVARYQDGYGMGNLFKISFDDTGTITGSFTNGVKQVLGQLALATFNNPTGLERVGENLYQASVNSGSVVKGAAGSTVQSSITSGALEMSNVDLAQEFTNMIVAQRGFQANARVITTADSLLEEIVRLKR